MMHGTECNTKHKKVCTILLFRTKHKLYVHITRTEDPGCEISYPKQCCKKWFIKFKLGAAASTVHEIKNTSTGSPEGCSDKRPSSFKCCNRRVALEKTQSSNGGHPKADQMSLAVVERMARGGITSGTQADDEPVDHVMQPR